MLSEKEEEVKKHTNDGDIVEEEAMPLNTTTTAKVQVKPSTTKNQDRRSLIHLVDDTLQENESLRIKLSKPNDELSKRKDIMLKLTQNKKIHIVALVIPAIISLWFASAILFTPEARAKAPFLLWDDGQLKFNEQGQPTICPRASICSEGFCRSF